MTTRKMRSGGFCAASIDKQPCKNQDCKKCWRDVPLPKKVLEGQEARKRDMNYGEFAKGR